MAAKKAERKPTEKAEKPGKSESGEKGSDAYVVFARRFRPRSFSDVVGQSPTTSALRQALNTGRIAQAYLFCGPRGVGKTSLARIVAKALNCLNGKGPNGVAEEPCNECDACESIQEGRALDVIEMDAATNRGIEEVRSLRENVGIAPAQLRYKVYIIDEVHMLTKEAWNAFLKTLEEPPAHVKFIFATTDPNNVPETILSRCQRYDLRRIGPADIVTRLKQICVLDKIQFDDGALSRIASLAKGGLRDAEGLLDQAVNLGQGKVTDQTVRELSGAAPDELITDMLKQCASGNTADVLLKAHQALESGADPEDMLSSFGELLRGTLLSKVCGADSPLLEGHAHLKNSYAELGKVLSEDQMLMLLQLFANARRQMRDAVQTRLPLEMALIRASRAKDLVDLGKIISALESGAQVPGARGSPTGQPPDREGSRPNSQGRQAGTVENRPAALQESPAARPADAVLVPVDSGISAEQWSSIMSAISSQKGGALLASALSHSQSVQYDEAAGALTLGFAADQLFYRDSLEKPQNQSTLLAALKQVLGKAVTVKVERATGSTRTQKAVMPPPARLQVRPPAPAQPVRKPVHPDEVVEEEFDGVGELPLPTPVSGEADVAPQSSGDEDVEESNVPVAPPVVIAKTSPILRDPADLKAYEAHPLVKLVLKETGGAVISVQKK